MNLKMIHAADPEIIALKAAGVFALGHHIPAVNGINSPTNRILKESRSRVYTSPMYKATNMEKIAKTGTDSLVHLRIFLSEKVFPNAIDLKNTLVAFKERSRFGYISVVFFHVKNHRFLTAWGVCWVSEMWFIAAQSPRIDRE